MWTESSHKSYSLKDAELQYIIKEDQRDYILADALNWLCHLESNKSIQIIATQTLHGILGQGYLFGWGEYPYKIPRITTYVNNLDLDLMAKISWDNLLEVKEEPETHAHKIWTSLISLCLVKGQKISSFDSNRNLESIFAQQPSGTLMKAIENRNLDVIAFLIEKGADVKNIRYFYQPALQAAAAQWGDLDVVKFLVQKGADVNAVGGHYGTALQAAARWGHLDIVRFLIEKEADVNAVEGEYGTALQAAACWAHLEVIKLLVEYDADVSALGGRFGNALQAALYCRHLRVVKYLVNKGADVDLGGPMYGNILAAALAGSEDDVTNFC